MISREGSKDYYSDFKVGGRGEGTKVSHLLFIDDTLLFYEDSV